MFYKGQILIHWKEVKEIFTNIYIKSDIKYHMAYLTFFDHSDCQTFLVAAVLTPVPTPLIHGAILRS